MVREHYRRNVWLMVLAGMLMPSSLGAEFARAYNSVFPELAAKHRSAFYPFFLKGVVGDPALLLADRIHPNARAVGIIAKNILPTVIGALELGQAMDRTAA